MKKFVALFLILSFFCVDAQKKKSTTKKKPKAKTTKTKAAPKEEEPVAVVTPVPEEVPEPDYPINSLSILNAKSPASFRKYRDLNLVKKGDSMVSVKNTPIPYGFIDDKDILKSVVVWEIIDMNEKLNQPFYHNEDGLVSKNKSLYQILFDAINEGKITEVYDDELFTTRLKKEAIKSRIKKEGIRESVVDYVRGEGKMTDKQIDDFIGIYNTFKDDSGNFDLIRAAGKMTDAELGQFIDTKTTKTEDIKALKIKGQWYIDRRDSQMKYRLIGIAAMGEDASMKGQTDPNGQPLPVELVDLFWVYYPDAREVLANNVVFNSKNLSSDITYDDLLNARRFSSIIYKSDNGMGNGVIKDYIPRDADEQLEESERIKMQILQMENDMWNY